MYKIRKSNERGLVNHGWLKARHSFSFGSYYDPSHLHFGPLRVINQDIIAAGAGFPEHPHEDMEIVTYIIRGELSHKDSSGGGSTIYPGRVQRMSAGEGIVHSEFNRSNEETELLQMWVFPDEKGYEPGYEEKTFNEDGALNNWQLIVSGKENVKDSLHINRELKLYRSFLNEAKKLEYQTNCRFQWFQIIAGDIRVNDILLNAGDGLGIKDEKELKIEALKNSHFLMFDMN